MRELNLNELESVTGGVGLSDIGAGLAATGRVLAAGARSPITHRVASDAALGAGMGAATSWLSSGEVSAEAAAGGALGGVAGGAIGRGLATVLGVGKARAATIGSNMGGLTGAAYTGVFTGQGPLSRTEIAMLESGGW